MHSYVDQLTGEHCSCGCCCGSGNLGPHRFLYPWDDDPTSIYNAVRARYAQVVSNPTEGEEVADSPTEAAHN